MPILDWQNQADWLSAIEAYAGDVLTPGVREHVRRGRSYCDSDDASWLPEGVQSAFINAFANYYRAARAFHGCRPLDVGAYVRKGFLGHDEDELKREFLLRFPAVPEDVVRNAARELDSSRRSERQKTWFVLTEGEIVERCGSYVIHGSVNRPGFRGGRLV